jgi:hypothetical protein
MDAFHEHVEKIALNRKSIGSDGKTGSEGTITISLRSEPQKGWKDCFQRSAYRKSRNPVGLGSGRAKLGLVPVR